MVLTGLLSRSGSPASVSSSGEWVDQTKSRSCLPRLLKPWRRQYSGEAVSTLGHSWRVSGRSASERCCDRS